MDDLFSELRSKTRQPKAQKRRTRRRKTKPATNHPRCAVCGDELTVLCRNRWWCAVCEQAQWLKYEDRVGSRYARQGND